MDTNMVWAQSYEDKQNHTLKKPALGTTYFNTLRNNIYITFKNSQDMHLAPDQSTRQRPKAE